MKNPLLATVLFSVLFSAPMRCIPVFAAEAETTSGKPPDPASNVLQSTDSLRESKPAPKISGTTESYMFLSQKQQMRQLDTGTYARQNLNVMPFYEILSLRADHLGYSGLSIHLQAIAGLDLADVYFDNRFIADPVVAYVQLQTRFVDARLGRQMIFSGAAEGIHMDGARLTFITPVHLGLDGYAGLLVSPKQGPDWYQDERASGFDDFGRGFTDWKREGDFAVGGRFFFRYEENANAGVSLLALTDNHELATQLLGADLNIIPTQWLSLTAKANLDLAALAIRDAISRIDFTIGDIANIGVDYKHVDPTLFISNTSIFSVFSNEKHNAAGISLGLTLIKRLTVFAAFHQLFYQYLQDNDGQWQTADETGQQIDTDITFRFGSPDRAGNARVGFGRVSRSATAVNQIRLGTLVPFGASGFKSALNAYIDVYEQPILEKNYSLLGDVGIYYYTDRIRTGATFRAGNTPWSDAELSGMVTFAYNFLKTFSNQEQP